MILTTSLPLLIAIGAWRFHESPCVEPRYSASVQETLDLVLRHAEMQFPPGLLFGSQNYACALLAFVISEDGLAEDVSVIRSQPSGAMARASMNALRGYRFQRSAHSAREAALLFEIRVSEDDNSIEFRPSAKTTSSVDESQHEPSESRQ
jgi:hypothetical protein